MGGAAKNIGRIGSGVLTLGGSELARKALGVRNPISQGLQLPGTILTGGAAGPSNMPSVFGYQGQQNPYISGPFNLDPNQVAADQQAITGLGNKQYGDTSQFIEGDMASRQAGRDKLAQALTRQGQASFMQGLPDIEERLNAQHLLNGSGLGQEIGRQQGNLATNIANQMGVLGAQDVDYGSQARAAALQGRQGFETGALQRGLSLEDYINQANVAKTIGAQMAPQPPSGKAQFGAAAQGVGALAPWATTLKGK